MNEINKLYPNEIEIETTHLGLRAKFSHNIGLLSVQRDFMNRSFAFKLVEYIFFNPNAQTKDIEQVFEVSGSTIYRTVMRINKLLQERYQISINFQPAYNKGDENHIQNFLLNFFLEKTDPLTWIFELTNETFISRLAITVSKAIEFAINIDGIRAIKYAVAIGAYRYLQGYKNIPDQYQPDFLYLEKTLINYLTHNNIPIWKQILPNQDDPQDEHYLYHIFTYLIPIDFTSFSYQLSNYFDDASPEFKARRELKNIVKSLAQKYHIEVDDLNKFCQNVVSEMKITFSNIYSDFFPIAHSLAYVDNVKR